MQTFLLFGITSDLMKKKGLPALFALHKKGVLASDFRIVGFSRKAWEHKELLALVGSSLGSSATLEEAAAFAARITMVEGAAPSIEDYKKLEEAVGTPNQLIAYLCVAPEFYAPIIETMGKSGMLLHPLHLLIEKPFGHSLASAQELQKLLTTYVTEDEVYRIDHYLAKDGAEQLKQVDPTTVRKIEVYLLEASGVEERGELYDTIGALHDVVQNHMLEMAALALGGDRIETLSSLPLYTTDQVQKYTTRGQYEGYREIRGVPKDSQTETYCKIETSFIRDGVTIPVMLEAGKRLAARKEVILTHHDGSTTTISFNSKNNEYETLFAEALLGDRGRFVDIKEVEALWRFIDPIEEAWAKNAIPLLSYTPDTGDILLK